MSEKLMPRDTRIEKFPPLYEVMPCPFCGGGATIDNAGGKYQAWCKHCCCIHMGVFYNTEAEAITAWNRRAQPASEPLTLEQLRQMDGETVFVGESDFWLSGIGTVSVEDGGVFNPDDQDGYWPFDDYGEWLAYRTKPERSEGE